MLDGQSIKIPFYFVTDIQTIDVFAELAGETDADFDRVLSFHDAVVGYSPLIFGLEGKSSLQDFMDACRCVQDALNYDVPSVDGGLKLKSEWVSIPYGG